MRLKFDRSRLVWPVLGCASIRGFTRQLHMVLHQDTIMEHRDKRGARERPVGGEHRCRPDDIEGLPCSGLAHRVDQRWRLLIDRRGLTIDVRFVLERIEDLDLVARIPGARRGEKQLWRPR